MPANKREIIAKLDVLSDDKVYDPVVSVRIPKEILKTIDEWVKDAKKRGKRANRSTIVVELLKDGLRIKRTSQE